MNKEKKTMGYCPQCQTIQLFPISGIKTSKCPLCSIGYIKKTKKNNIKDKIDDGQLSLLCSENLQNSEKEN